MFGKMFAAAALVASTAAVLAPSAALARDRNHGGWQNQERHSQGGYGNHGYNRGNGGHRYNRGGGHGYNAGNGYYNNGYYPRQHGYQQQHGYDRGYNQHYQSGHDNYRGH